MRSGLAPCLPAALRRVLQQAQERHGLTLQLGFELEFFLFHKPEKDEAGGSSGRGSVPPPLDGSNYCSASALDAAAPGGERAPPQFWPRLRKTECPPAWRLALTATAC